MAQGYQRFAVPGAFLDGNMPFRGNRSEKAQGLRGVRPCQVGEMTEGAAMVEVIGGVMGGERQGLQRERRCDQQQYRKRP